MAADADKYVTFRGASPKKQMYNTTTPLPPSLSHNKIDNFYVLNQFSL